MLRENKSLVDEDAYGNKQVPFKVGLHIKGDRRAQHSPIYELKAVYTNKEASARANLWQRVVDEEGLRGEGKAGADGELVGCRDDASKGPGSNVSSSPALSVEGSPSEEAKRGRRKELLLTFSPAGTNGTPLPILCVISIIAVLSLLFSSTLHIRPLLLCSLSATFHGKFSLERPISSRPHSIPRASLPRHRHQATRRQFSTFGATPTRDGLRMKSNASSLPRNTSP
jgi:hypothetical protein